MKCGNWGAHCVSSDLRHDRRQIEGVVKCTGRNDQWNKEGSENQGFSPVPHYMMREEMNEAELKEMAAKLFLHRKELIEYSCQPKKWSSNYERVKAGLADMEEQNQMVYPRPETIDWAPIILSDVPIKEKWESLLNEMLNSSPNDKIRCIFSRWEKLGVFEKYAIN